MIIFLSLFVRANNYFKYIFIIIKFIIRITFTQQSCKSIISLSLVFFNLIYLLLFLFIILFISFLNEIYFTPHFFLGIFWRRSRVRGRKGKRLHVKKWKFACFGRTECDTLKWPEGHRAFRCILFGQHKNARILNSTPNVFKEKLPLCHEHHHFFSSPYSQQDYICVLMPVHFRLLFILPLHSSASINIKWPCQHFSPYLNAAQFLLQHSVLLCHHLLFEHCFNISLTSDAIL